MSTSTPAFPSTDSKNVPQLVRNLRLTGLITSAFSAALGGAAAGYASASIFIGIAVVLAIMTFFHAIWCLIESSHYRIVDNVLNSFEDEDED